MERKIGKLAILFIFVGIGFRISSVAIGNDDPYPTIKIPIMPSGYDIKKFINKPDGIKSTSYFVKIKYPAPEVLQFYDIRLKEIGFGPVIDGKFGSRQWDCITDMTKNDKYITSQLLSLWFNPTLKFEAVLELIYKKSEDNSENTIHVICQIQPAIDTAKLDSFIEQLKSSLKFVDFMELLDTYRMANGEINFEKAVSENPKNPHLKKFKSIINEMHHERQTILGRGNVEWGHVVDNSLNP